MILPDAILAQLAHDGMTLTKVSCTGEVSTEGNVVQAEVVVPPNDRTVHADICVGLAGAGGSLIRLPKAGDTGIMAMPEGDIADGYLIGWVHTGQAMPAPESIPADTYLLRAAQDEHLLLEVDGEGTITLKAAGGTAVLELMDGKAVLTCADIRLGSNGASMAVALAPLVAQEINSHKGTYQGHVHGFTQPLLPLPGGATTPPIQPPAATGDMGAKKVKGE